METFEFIPVEKCKFCDIDIGDMVSQDFNLFLPWIVSNKNIELLYSFAKDAPEKMDFSNSKIPDEIQRALGFDRINDIMENRSSIEHDNN